MHGSPSPWTLEWGRLRTTELRGRFPLTPRGSSVWGRGPGGRRLICPFPTSLQFPWSQPSRSCSGERAEGRRVGASPSPSPSPPRPQPRTLVPLAGAMARPGSCTSCHAGATARAADGPRPRASQPSRPSRPRALKLSASPARSAPRVTSPSLLQLPHARLRRQRPRQRQVRATQEVRPAWLRAAPSRAASGAPGPTPGASGECPGGGERRACPRTGTPSWSRVQVLEPCPFCRRRTAFTGPREVARGEASLRRVSPGPRVAGKAPGSPAVPSVPQGVALQTSLQE